MAYFLEIPARINLLGNPGDAYQGDYAVLSAAIDLHAGAKIEPDQELVFELTRPYNSGPGQRLVIDQHPIGGFPLPFNQKLDLLKAAANRLFNFSPEFREKVESLGFRISVWSPVPRHSGLGGSSLLVLLVLAGLRSCYKLDPQAHNDYILAEIAQKVEFQEMNVTCGYSDRYSPLFGGLAYVDYRGKLFQRGVGREPLATYERLDEYIDFLPLLCISTGVRPDSGDSPSRLRARYLEEYKTWLEKGGDPPLMVCAIEAAWESTWRGKIALLQGDFQTFGALMNENHRLVDEMLTACGVADGAGWANNLFIKTARKNGALGAKLTGAAGGGSVVALVRPGEEDQLSRAWESEAKAAGLKNTWIFRPKIVQRGMTVKKGN